MTGTGRRERFVDEPLVPVAATADASLMAAGGPGLPQAFLWQGRKIEVEKVLRSWRETGPCRHGSGERYARRHWFEIVAAGGATLKIYFERQPRGGRTAPRWWLFTLTETD